MNTILILYLPVIHRGYVELLYRYSWVECLYVLGEEFVEELAEHIEIRALDQKVAAMIAAKLGPSKTRYLNRGELSYILHRGKTVRIITADESLTRKFVDTYLSEAIVTFESTFLRWEESNVLSLSDIPFDEVSTSPDDQNYMRQAELEGEASSDWWRRVGVVLKTKDRVFKAHNSHVPSEYTPYINGDPRDCIESGTRSELSSVLHSEKSAFAQALRAGVSTVGADLYTTVFPCPDCAKLVAFSGVRRVFYKNGHSSLDGVAVLKSQGVKIIKVE